MTLSKTIKISEFAKSANCHMCVCGLHNIDLIKPVYVMDLQCYTNQMITITISSFKS